MTPLGTNRMGATRLQHAAHILDVPVRWKVASVSHEKAAIGWRNPDSLDNRRGADHENDDEGAAFAAPRLARRAKGGSIGGWRR